MYIVRMWVKFSRLLTGIVHRGRVIYLITTFFDYPDIRQVSLQRIQRAKLLNETASRPTGFTVEKYVKEGGFDYGSKSAKKISIKLKFLGPAGDNLYETPLSNDQEINDLSSNDIQIKIVKATVEDTWELRWWILGFGDQVEVMFPIKLRREFHSLAASLSELYG